MNATSTSDCTHLSHHFLIAMPSMADPYFARSLIYICEHNEQGALGVIVNRPLDMSLGLLFEKIELPLSVPGFSEQPVHFGGPVQTDRGFVLHRPLGAWQSTLAVTADIGLTSSRDILESLGSPGAPSEILMTLGYAGWSAGQLEHELSRNDWLTVAADPEILFALPYEERLPTAMQRLGVSFLNLAEGAGHA